MSFQVDAGSSRPAPSSPEPDDRRAEGRKIPHAELARYYRGRAVRARIAEYCGGVVDSLSSWSAWGIAGFGGRRNLRQTDGAPVPVPKEDLMHLFDEGADVCRSFADRGGALLQLDIDYVNPEDPGEVYRDPKRAFGRVEPVYRAALRAFKKLGVRPLVLLTGRGYHMTARVPAGASFYEALFQIGVLGETVRGRHLSRGGSWVRWGQAHEGAGRLMELLAHRVLRRVEGRTEVPVTLADVEVPEGGAYILLDLSAYGDPLFERYARCAFSSHQKDRPDDALARRPWTLCVPRKRIPLRKLLDVRTNPRAAARLAARVKARIPDLSGTDLHWIQVYRASRLARFHRSFDEGWHDAPADWAATYDRLELARLPACARLPLEFPNPALLRPVFLRTVALTLWGEGWHPRSIAGLIRSKYERDYGWGDLWYRYDAATRADFYVRLFCGAVACGVDDATRFTCASQKLRGVCVEGNCGYDLARLGIELARNVRIGMGTS